jgi:competence protein ComEC
MLLLTFAAICVVLFHIPYQSIWLSLCILMIAIGYYQWHDARNVTHITLPELKQSIESSGTSSMNGTEAVLQGMLASTVIVDGDKASFTVQASEINFKSGLTKTLPHEKIIIQLRLLEPSQQDVADSWQRGDTLKLSGVLRIPAPARNFGGFDYQRYLQMQSIHWQFAVKGTAQIEWESHSHGFNTTTLLRAMDTLRAELGNRIERLFPDTQAGFMKAMLIGDNEDMDPDRFQQFSSLGLTHILAISGLNIAVFLAALIWLLRRFHISKANCYLIACIALPFYILLTGASPSVVRAGLMAMLVCLTARQNLQKDILHVICIVGVGMLIWHPYYLLDVSFQLSYLVTIGLIVGVSRVSHLLPLRSKWLANTIALTVVSQLVSFPISIYYFNQFSLLSGMANAVFVPIISLIIYPAGLIAMLLSFVYMPIASGLGTITSWLNTWIFACTDQMQAWTIFQTIWPTPSIIWIIGYFLLVITLCMVLLRRKEMSDSQEGTGLFIPDWQMPETSSKRWGLHRFTSRQRSRITVINRLLICVCIGFTLHMYIGYSPERWYKRALVQMIDVGQGDAILITTSERKHILIDGGGTVQFQKSSDSWKLRNDPYDVGSKLLVPLLKKRGVQQIDALILTHQDLDHSGGLQAVIEQIPVKNFYFNGTYKPNTSNQKLFQTALDRRIPLIIATAGQSVVIDDKTTIHFLYPRNTSESITIQKKQNNLSVAHLLEISGTRWLFTGDMELPSEQDLIALLSKNKEQKVTDLGQIDFLKVAHHGSKSSTSEAWLDYFKPSYALISAGVANTYGHPAQEVIGRLTNNGVKIFRTDQRGEIQIQINEGEIAIRTKLQQAKP